MYAHCCPLCVRLWRVHAYDVGFRTYVRLTMSFGAASPEKNTESWSGMNHVTLVGSLSLRALANHEPRSHFRHVQYVKWSIFTSSQIPERASKTSHVRQKVSSASVYHATLLYRPTWSTTQFADDVQVLSEPRAVSWVPESPAALLVSSHGRRELVSRVCL